jgi:catechol 2,3-dioxygenase-like lactoylglutathione lyase family enzyme
LPKRTSSERNDVLFGKIGECPAARRSPGGYGRDMIRGAHVVLSSSDPDADRAFFRDVLGCPFVDAGHGWLIFALPPTELAIHPAEGDAGHELFLMCDDLQAFVAQMTQHDVACSPVSQERWGSVTSVKLPGGGLLRVYEPSHASPLATG